MVYQINVTGEGIESMSLTFKSVPEYRRWSWNITNVRNQTTYVLALSVQARVIYLVSTWIPLADLFVQDWGNDFVPFDITANMVEARQFLDWQLSPNPALLRILQ